MTLLDRGLARFGADPAQFRALFGAALKTDFRRANRLAGGMRQKELSLKARMIWSFAIYVLLSLPVALSARAVQDPRTYAAIALGYALAMLGMLIVLEFGVAVVQSEDAAVLAARPVSPATYTLSKVANLAVYVGFYGLAVTGLPLALAPLAPGAGAAFTACLGAAMVLGSAAAGGLLVAAYGLLLRRLSRERARDLLTWLTILFSIAIPVSYLLISRWMDRIGHTLHLPLDRHPWMLWLPPVWLAGAMDWALGARDAVTGTLALRAAGLLLSGFLAWALLRRWAFGLSAEGVAPAGDAAEGAPRAPRLAWLRGCFAGPAEWGVFRLLAAYLRRDRGTKARILPQFGMSAAFFAIALFQGSGLEDPWAGGQPGIMAFLVAAHLAMTCAWVPLLLRFSEQWEAAWIFAVAPGATLADMARGLQRAVLLGLVAPCFLLTWLFFLACWGDPVHALLHVLPPFLGAVALMDLALLWRRPIPLSTRYMKGETGTRMALTFTLMIAFAGLWLLQQALAGNLALTMLLIGAELAAVFAMDAFMTARLARRGVVLADL